MLTPRWRKPLSPLSDKPIASRPARLANAAPSIPIAPSSVGSGCVFSSTEVAPSIQQVDQTFGATHPGIYDRERHLFLLNFRGLTFQFPVEPKFEVGGARWPITAPAFLPTSG